MPTECPPFSNAVGVPDGWYMSVLAEQAERDLHPEHRGDGDKARLGLIYYRGVCVCVCVCVCCQYRDERRKIDASRRMRGVPSVVDRATTMMPAGQCDGSLGKREWHVRTAVRPSAVRHVGSLKRGKILVGRGRSMELKFG